MAKPPENHSPAVIGRNDPCPCGSGKKYKKCCLESDAAVQANKLSPDQLSPWSRDAVEALKNEWTDDKVACLGTAEIVTRLEELGIDGCETTFVEMTGGRTAAMSIFGDWVGSLTTPPEEGDEDFMRLAACELWKRYRPEHPSAEMIDGWVIEGYQRLEANKEGEVADVWLRLWEHVRLKIEPWMTTYSAADPVFEISQFFGIWIQDFIMVIGNESINSAKYTEIGIRLIGEVLHQFVDESLDAVLNLRCDLGRLLCRAGRCEEGQAMFQAIINEHPEQSCGYIELADELGRAKQEDADIPRAIALLEQALAYPVIDAADWHVEDRLADLRQELGRRTLSILGLKFSASKRVADCPPFD